MMSQFIHALKSEAALVIYAGLFCFMLAVANINFAFANNFISIWVVNAVLLIFIFRSKTSMRWSYYCVGLLATFVANMMGGGPVWISLGLAFCNSFEILLPILLVKRENDQPLYIENFNRQLIMLALSLPIGCVLSAVSASLITVGWANPEFNMITFNWFSTDLLALLSILPIGLSVTKERLDKLLHPEKIVELLFAILLAMLITWYSMVYVQIRFIIILIPLLYGSFRLGLLGTTLMCFSISGVYMINLIFIQTHHQIYTSIAELISHSSLLMSITLIPALITSILIEQRDNFEAKLMENEARFYDAIHYSGIGMSLVSSTGQWTLVNPALCKLTGYDEKQLLQLSPTDITDEEDFREEAQLINKLVNNEIQSYQLEKRLIKKNNDKIWVSQVVSGVYGKDNKIINYVMQIEDITLQKTMQTELKNQATHDELTGLNNRREIESRINQLISNQRTPKNVNTIFYIDLDEFKQVNDAAGHAAGDALLKEISNIFTKSVRATDSVARLGGDEFIILLPECPLNAAIMIAENILQRVEVYSFHWQGVNYKIGCSIGMIEFKSKEITLENLLKKADTACYSAKRNGGHSFSIVMD